MSYAGDTGETSAIAVPAATVRTVAFKSGTIAKLVATGALTAGRFGLFRWDMPAKVGGAGAHFHRTFSESFYVLEGIVSLFDGRAWSTANPGDYLYVPEGGIHGFRNDADAAASMLILFAPGIVRERYFEELAEIGASGRTLSKEEWAELYARHDQTVVED
ncbi:MAG TPA: cupin domain-containing protein [Candidatus Eisenbacteria bacterium]|nr:cupin domain-containing protein [Candidatus Eisenbacteria bacterium]